MPRKSPKLCNQAGCGRLTYEAYCEVHQTDRHKEYNVSRTDKREVAFYGSSEWKRLRKYKKKLDPLCEHCLAVDEVTPADVADHIIPVKVQWELRLTLSNLQSLCNRHHNIKTAKDKKKYS